MTVQRSGRRWSAALPVAGALLLALIVGVAVGESMGWPFLAGPLQRWLTSTLQRDVVLGADPQRPQEGGFRLRLVGGLRLETARLEIAAPPWGRTPQMMQATDVSLALRYVDLWRAWQGQPLRVARLEAATLDAQLERRADGRVSWQFRPRGDDAPPLPSFGLLRVAAGSVHYLDEPLAIDALARLSLVDQASLPTSAAAGRRAASVAEAASTAAVVPGGSRLQVDASGHIGSYPLKFDLRSSGLMPWAADEAHAVALPLTLRATVGRATLDFDGSAGDVLRLQRLSGRFRVGGPSLAAVGDPLGVTLPTTAAFRADGVVVQQGSVWRVRVDQATVGASRLNGAFSYERGRAVPMLAGRLGGSRLLLSDLGPLVGTTAAVAALPVVPAAAGVPSATAAGDAPGVVPGAAPVPLPASTRGPGKLLPNRPFDLAALRRMDANVLIDLREVNLNTPLLEPLRPLRAHLVLDGGVLTLRDIDARAASGQLGGELELDGREAVAQLSSRLHWNAVRLENWLHPARAGASPYVTGRLQGRATLAGRGKSTAEILASLGGRVHSELRGGTVSHLAIEAAGLDLAQALGVMVKGDDLLPVNCAVVDLVAKAGVLKPGVIVLDTPDSTVWVDGELSLASETLDLRAVVSPKDVSPLALRTPLRLRGSFARPEVTVERGPMARKLALALMLGLLNPVAAVLPLVDLGDTDAARRGAEGCQQALLGKSEAALRR